MKFYILNSAQFRILIKVHWEWKYAFFFFLQFTKLEKFEL